MKHGSGNSLYPRLRNTSWEGVLGMLWYVLGVQIPPHKVFGSLGIYIYMYIYIIYIYIRWVGWLICHLIPPWFSKIGVNMKRKWTLLFWCSWPIDWIDSTRFELKIGRLPSEKRLRKELTFCLDISCCKLFLHLCCRSQKETKPKTQPIVGGFNPFEQILINYSQSFQNRAE